MAGKQAKDRGKDKPEATTIDDVSARLRREREGERSGVPMALDEALADTSVPDDTTIDAVRERLLAGKEATPADIPSALDESSAPKTATDLAPKAGVADKAPAPAPAPQTIESALTAKPASQPMPAPPGLRAPPSWDKYKASLGDSEASDDDNGFNKALVKAKFALASATPDQKDDFAAELRDIRQDFKNAKSDLEWREVAHTAADALTQMAGAAYGLKTGANIDIKTKDHDFTKDLALLQEQNKTDLGDLRGRREEAARAGERADDLAFRVGKEKADQVRFGKESAQRAFQTSVDIWRTQADDARQSWMAQMTADHNKITEAYQQQMLLATETRNDADRQRLIGEADRKYKGETLAEISKVMGDPKKKPEDKAAAAMATMERLGVPTAKSHAALFEKSIIPFRGDVPRDPDEAMLELGKLAEGTTPPRGLIPMAHPKHPGEPMSVTESNVPKMEAAGWKRQ